MSFLLFKNMAGFVTLKLLQSLYSGIQSLQTRLHQHRLAFSLPTYTVGQAACPDHVGWHAFVTTFIHSFCK